MIGFLCFAIGTGLTVASYANAASQPGGGRYMVCYGLILGWPRRYVSRDDGRLRGRVASRRRAAGPGSAVPDETEVRLAMSTVVSCTCGAKIKLPEVRSSQAFRCPRCKAELTARRRKPDRHVGSGRSAQPGCNLSDLSDDRSARTRPRSFVRLATRCTTASAGPTSAAVRLMAAKMLPRPTRSAPVETPRSAWGETKKCPACGEKIKSIALRCRYCGTEFDTVDPLSLKDLRKQVKKGERLQVDTHPGGRSCSFFRSSAASLPLIAIAATAYVLLQRDVIAKAGPSYLVMGYSAMGISYLYSILMVLFVLFSVASR